MLNHFRTQMELHLEGKPVGKVEMSQSADSWYMGHFEPARAFSEFAALFGEWSLLLHADEDEPTLSSSASDELRKIERAIDALHAELVLKESGKHIRIDQLNIDGELVEMKFREPPPVG
jgi:hypothetical protein